MHAVRVHSASPRGRGALLALLGALAAWSGWFIFRTSFLSGGRRVFCLFDDAMISMTYARNLVEGFGLNWARRGAPVEGFTHPLWTALMVPVNLLPLPLDRRCLVVQLASLALLLLHVELVRRLMLRHFTRPGARYWLPACALTAFYYPLNFWALEGMETGLQAVLTTASVLLALDVVHGRRDRHLALLLVGTLAVLLRMDMAPLVIAVQVYVWMPRGGALPRRAWPPPRGWWLGAAALGLAVTGYLVFRWEYFHDLLPNTYYLKLGGIPLEVRLLRGGSTLLDMLLAHAPLLLVVAVGLAPLLFPPAWPGAVYRTRHCPETWRRRLALPAAVFTLACAYSVAVGGDAWEDSVRANRFVAFAMPQVFVLFNALLNQALAAARRRRRCLSGAALRLGLAAITVLALLSANGLWPAAGAEEAEQAEESWKGFAVVSRPLFATEHAAILGQLRALQAIAEPSAVVAVSWAGIPAYFSDFRMVDELGYNDRHLARRAPSLELTEDTFDEYMPGHAKWDYAYLVDSQRPDAFLQLWAIDKEHLLATVRLIRSRGYRRAGSLWLDPSSPRLHPPPP
jgi:arabinofuranosyltransferase